MPASRIRSIALWVFGSPATSRSRVFLHAEAERQIQDQAIRVEKTSEDPINGATGCGENCDKEIVDTDGRKWIYRS